MNRLITSLAVAFLVPTLSALAEESEGSLLSKVSLGEHWLGEKLSVGDLAGHVTLVEFWGYNCGPCVASIPGLVKLQDELRDTGFTVVAVHSQSVPRETVLKLLKKNKVNYVVTSNGSVPGNPVSGIPDAFLFDSSGKLIERGQPMALKAKIHALVESEPHFLAAGRKYTKLAPLADSLKKTKAYGQILKRLEKDLQSEGAPGEEAKYLSERITRHGEKLLEKAREVEKEDALKAQQSYTELANLWKGSPIGDKAAARLKELKADKDFQTELKASAAVAGILAECDKFISQPNGTVSLESGPNKKIAANVTVAAQSLKKKFPGSGAIARLDQELSVFGLKA